MWLFTGSLFLQSGKFMFDGFRFRKKQDENATGISSSSKVLRKSRNLVSMRFNMFNWMLEVVSVLLVMIGENPMLENFHNLVNSCGTPVVFFYKYFFLILTCIYLLLIYFLGIEENRKLARIHFRRQMRMFTRKKVSANETSLESNSA